MLTALAVGLESRPYGWTFHSGEELRGSSLPSFAGWGAAGLSLRASSRAFTAALRRSCTCTAVK